MSHTQTISVGDLFAALEARIPRSLSCSWDNDGLSCCPDLTAPVTGVVIALDLTSEVIDLAEATGSSVILTHHPLIFKGLTAVNGQDLGSRQVIRMLRAGISSMAFHTRLDTVTGGVNDVLAARLGLTNVTPFGFSDNSAGACMGRVGTLPSPMDPADFATFLAKTLAVPAAPGDPSLIWHLDPVNAAVTYAACGRPVHRVAVLGGGGDSEVEAAMAAGADTYVTGDLKYHQLCNAPDGTINLYAAGHYFTEFPVCPMLGAWVKEICPAIPVHILGGSRIATVQG